MRRLLFERDAWDDLGWWANNEPKMVARIHELIANAIKTPFSGLGKPEPLKYGQKGYWSRRITQEHRLVYKVDGETIVIIAAKGHY